MEKMKVKLWNLDGQSEGTIEVPESRPNVIRFNDTIYTYNFTFGVYTEIEVYDIERLVES